MDKLDKLIEVVMAVKNELEELRKDNRELRDEWKRRMRYGKRKERI